MATSEKPIMSVEEARRMIASNEAQAVDVRGEDAWEDAHVPGAVRLEPDELDSAADRLESDRGVVVIANGDADVGRDAVDKLREQGFEASLLEGGMDAWKSEDYTIQPSHDPDDDAPVEPDG